MKSVKVKILVHKRYDAFGKIQEDHANVSKLIYGSLPSIMDPTVTKEDFDKVFPDMKTDLEDYNLVDAIINY